MRLTMGLSKSEHLLGHLRVNGDGKGLQGAGEEGTRGPGDRVVLVRRARQLGLGVGGVAAVTVAAAHSAAGVEEELIGGRGDATEDLVYEVGLPVTSEVAVVLGVDLSLHTGDRASEGGADRVRVVRFTVAGEGVHQLRLEHLMDVAAVEVLDDGVGAAVAGERVLLMYLTPVGTAQSRSPAGGEVVVACGVVGARVDGRVTEGVDVGREVGKAGEA